MPAHGRGTGPWRHRLNGDALTELRRGYDPDFKAGAVQLVCETDRPIAQIARELGVNEGTLGNWVAKDRKARADDDGVLSESERQELGRLRKDVTELRMQRDVLKRSVALWVNEAMGRKL